VQWYSTQHELRTDLHPGSSNFQAPALRVGHCFLVKGLFNADGQLYEAGAKLFVRDHSSAFDAVLVGITVVPTSPRVKTLRFVVWNRGDSTIHDVDPMNVDLKKRDGGTLEDAVRFRTQFTAWFDTWMAACLDPPTNQRAVKTRNNSSASNSSNTSDNSNTSNTSNTSNKCSSSNNKNHHSREKRRRAEPDDDDDVMQEPLDETGDTDGAPHSAGSQDSPLVSGITHIQHQLQQLQQQQQQQQQQTEEVRQQQTKLSKQQQKHVEQQFEQQANTLQASIDRLSHHVHQLQLQEQQQQQQYDRTLVLLQQSAEGINAMLHEVRAFHTRVDAALSRLDPRAAGGLNTAYAPPPPSFTGYTRY
jgi:hypothetical protein